MGRRGILRLGVALALAVALAPLGGGAADASSAAGLRLGKGAGFDRVVIDLPDGARVTQVHAGTGFALEIRGAAAPQAPAGLADLELELADLGGEGFRLSTGRDSRQLRAFLLEGPRVVLDLARGGTHLPLPPDAKPVPEAVEAVVDPATPDSPESGGSRESPEAPEPAPVPAPREPEAPRAEISGPPIGLKTLILVGVQGSGLGVDDLMKLEVPLQDGGELGALPPTGDGPVERISLKELARNRSEPLMISRAALDGLAHLVADEYESRGLPRPRIAVLLGPAPSRRAQFDGRVVMVIQAPAAQHPSLGSPQGPAPQRRAE